MPGEVEEERSARLVLVSEDGRVLGQLPPIRSPIPYWSEVESIVRAVREGHGIEVTIVRVLEVDGGRFMRGGHVTYLAETGASIACAPWDGALDVQPNRAHYAEVGGARADVAWASAILESRGVELTGRPVQVRTWNLSSLWRFPVGEDHAWLKAIPPFFAHEGRLLAAMATDERVPNLLAHEPSRLLLAGIPGDDLYEATLPQRLRMIDLLVDLQRAWIGRSDELAGMGVPDGRDAALLAAVGGVFERRRSQLPANSAAQLERFVRSLSQRLKDVRYCGLPDTLVHGDFHPGNVRGHGHELVLLDWGDSFIGHPLLDHGAFLDRAPGEWHPRLKAHWLERWRMAFPGSDPARAWRLLEPVAAARAAAVYQRFLDHIEPAEHPYHESDPVDWLCRAAELAEREAHGSF